MLVIHRNNTHSIWRWCLGIVACLIILGGLYVLSLVLAPMVALNLMKPIDVSTIPAPKTHDDRIIIPKIGVNIGYGSNGITSLDEGAWWRYPERGNPEKGGNFIVAAHRFSIQPTPQSTVIKSPFYHIDQLQNGDKIIIDYNGSRYGYEINKIFSVRPDQTEIESDVPPVESRLTLYSCGLDGAADNRVVLYAKPLGEVSFDTSNHSS